MAQPLLEVKDLKVHFPTDDGLVKAVDGVSYSLAAGETLGIVGESGSGKSVSSLTVMGLINPKQATISGEVFFQGQDLLKLPKDEMRTIRGEKISMIFQQPTSALNPVLGPFTSMANELGGPIRAHLQELVMSGRIEEMADRQPPAWRASWRRSPKRPVSGSIRGSGS